MLTRLEDHPLTLLDGSTALITIIPESPNTLDTISAELALELCEAEVQVSESCTYEYRLDGYLLSEEYGVVKRSSLNKYSGRIIPGNYVGTLSIDILSAAGEAEVGVLKLEVRARKMGHRSDYQDMLGDIADKCNELIMRSNTPVEQLVGPVFGDVSKGLYQRFAFLRSILDSQEFQDAVNKVVSSPVSMWSVEETSRDIRNVKRFDRNITRQIASANKRQPLPPDHKLSETLPSIPTVMVGSKKVLTIDTAENRFVKHALNTFLSLCLAVKERAGKDQRLAAEAGVLANRLDQWLSFSLFREIGLPDSIPLDNPVLQRKEGYREILRVWLMHDLASRITWAGGEDVYQGGKKDVAVLYEYWVFFRLLDIVQKVFQVEPKDVSSLISLDNRELNLNLRQGKHLAIKGIYEAKERIMNIEFSYNRPFHSTADRNNDTSGYPKGGSWTKTLRPDYTLSIWPHGLDGVAGKKIAEEEELIVHIHFDAKYKVDKASDLLGENPEDDKPLPVDPKDSDLMKMHAYRDAIRRTAGAYVIYPGSNSMIYKGFHEIIPGLGAFPLNPSAAKTHAGDISLFLKEVANHMMDRITQREKIAQKAFDTYKNGQPDPLYAKLPKAGDSNRDLLPDETWVLVCYYKNPKHLAWIQNNMRYNARAKGADALKKLSPETTGAKYILLHSNAPSAQLIYPLREGGPVLWTKQDLIDHEYPSKPSASHYLVYPIKKRIPVPEFSGLKFKIDQLGATTDYRGIFKPFPVTLDVLLRNKLE